MSSESRYLLQMIEEGIARRTHAPSQSENQTMLKADNGEFMELLLASNTENVAKCVATWRLPELSFEGLRAKHDPDPPAPPVFKKKADVPPPVEA